MKHALIPQPDFEKLVTYIYSMPVSFQLAQRAVEIQQIIQRTKLQEVLPASTDPELAKK